MEMQSEEEDIIIKEKNKKLKSSLKKFNHYKGEINHLYHILEETFYIERIEKLEN